MKAGARFRPRKQTDIYGVPSQRVARSKKVFSTMPSAGKIRLSVFWNIRGMVHFKPVPFTKDDSYLNHYHQFLKAQTDPQKTESKNSKSWSTCGAPSPSARQLLHTSAHQRNCNWRDSSRGFQLSLIVLEVIGFSSLLQTLGIP